MNSGIRPIVKYQYYSGKKEPETKTRNICNNVDFVSRTKRDYFPSKAARENIGHVGVGKHVEKLEKRFSSRVQAGLAWINPPGFYPSGFIRINPPNLIHFYPEKIKNKGKMLNNLID